MSGSATDLSRRALALEPSAAAAVAARVMQLRAAGRTILDFSVGEPDQPTPRPISSAAVTALGNGKTRYTASAGIPELRGAVVARYKKDFGVAFAPEEACITDGAKHALFLVCQALLDRGDEVVIPSPGWPTFSQAVRLAGARPLLVPTAERDGFRITARLVGRATTDRTRAVIINSPANPTGALVERDDLLVIGDMAQRHDFTILYDDSYGRLCFEKTASGVLQELKDAVGERLVMLGTTSKTYCMTGWRIGWVLGPQALVDACARLVSHSTQCATTFAQYGALQALTGPQKVVTELVAEFRKRRDAFHYAVATIRHVSCVMPGGGFFLFPNVSWYLRGGLTTVELAERLLEQHDVAVLPGEAFGAPGYLRLSFARPQDELKEGAARLRACLTGLPT